MEQTTLEKRQDTKTIIEWVIRIVISLLFLISAAAKLYPSPNFALATFEVKQLIPMGFSCNWAAWFSRTLIGCEFALGLLILQPHYYRKLVIPASFLMLFIFSSHLMYEIISSGNKGNCGCFGSLLPMTPLQAVIKNIVAMGLLGYLFYVRKGIADKSKFLVLTTVTFACIMIVFMLGTKCCGGGMNSEARTVEVVKEIDSTVVINDAKVNTTVSTVVQNDTVKKVEILEPKNKKSGFASLYSDIDKGKKILCFFAPGCEHCKATAKQLTELKKEMGKDFPEMKIVFMDEEAELIPEFFSFAGGKYTHKVLDVGAFWTIFGNRDTPGVFYLWNGNVIKEFDGIDAKAFKKAAFKKALLKEWK
jgi:thiol-disulfide isomerase/thioredoxin